MDGYTTYLLATKIKEYGVRYGGILSSATSMIVRLEPCSQNTVAMKVEYVCLHCIMSTADIFLKDSQMKIPRIQKRGFY